jgi:predicted TIM-barrel fold metal-dependent hydrolase
MAMVHSADGLPIKLGPCGTDEYSPLPLDPVTAEAVRIAQDTCTENARRTGVPRRTFLRSTCAAAVALLALDACSKAAHKVAGQRPGGTFRIPKEATTEPPAAEEALGGSEFVLDVQGHLLDHTLDPAAKSEFAAIASTFPQRRCGEHDPDDCFSIEHFLDEMFNRSDTKMLVLSSVPLPLAHDPLSPAVMRETRRVAGAVCHDDRLLLHGKVAPTTRSLPEVLAGMEELASAMPIVGWKTYTHLVGPGWWLDDHDAGAPKVGEAFIRKAVELGVPRIAVHKGLVPSAYNTPEDVGAAAAAHRDVSFVIYHSGYELGHVEGPYREGNRGIDALVTSLRRAGIGPNANVYADLGTTWWHLMRDPTQGAHAWGKLLQHVGEDNVVWGTDSIWYGTPQDQIQAFRALEISPELQERYGYPALTPERKAKVLGLNGARLYGVEHRIASACRVDPAELARARAATPGGAALHGPRTRREFLTLASRTG